MRSAKLYSHVSVSTCNKMTYGTTSGGGGNCTRVPLSTSICPKCGYNMTFDDRPEMDREDEALRVLVACWHRPTPSVMADIIARLRASLSAVIENVMSDFSDR